MIKTMLTLFMLCLLSLCYAYSLYALALLHGEWHVELCFRRRCLGRLFAVGVLVLSRRFGIGCVSHLPWVCTSTVSCCDRNVTCIELQWTLFDMKDHVVVVVTAPRLFPDHGETSAPDETNRAEPNRESRYHPDCGSVDALVGVSFHRHSGWGFLPSALWLGSPSIDTLVWGLLPSTRCSIEGMVRGRKRCPWACNLNDASCLRP